MNKITIILLVVVVALVYGFWWYAQPAGDVAPAPVAEQPAPQQPVAVAPDPDSSATLQQELGNLDLGDVGVDMQEVDAGISAL